MKNTSVILFIEKHSNILFIFNFLKKANQSVNFVLILLIIYIVLIREFFGMNNLIIKCFSVFLNKFSKNKNLV